MQSRLSDVAVNPQQLLLPNSKCKTLNERLAMVSLLSQELSQKVKGIEAIIGEAPDYIELGFLHFFTTGKQLFPDYRTFAPYYNQIHIATRIVAYIDPNLVPVSAGFLSLGLGSSEGVHAWSYQRPDGKYQHLWIAPLIVPKNN